MTRKDQLVNRTKFANSLRNDLSRALDGLAKKTDITKSKLLDQAVELLIEKYNYSPKE